MTAIAQTAQSNVATRLLAGVSVVIREAQNFGDSGEYVTLRQW